MPSNPKMKRLMKKILKTGARIAGRRWDRSGKWALSRCLACEIAAVAIGAVIPAGTWSFRLVIPLRVALLQRFANRHSFRNTDPSSAKKFSANGEQYLNQMTASVRQC